MGKIANTVVLSYSKAREIAEQLWGRGGTNSYSTNRIGAFYFSCAGHGGYIVDGCALSDAELEEIAKYIKPDELDVCIQESGEGEQKTITTLAVLSPFTFRMRSRRIKYEPNKGLARWVKHPIYVFEEDCDWSVLEKFTNIRAKGFGEGMTEEERKDLIERCFKRWHIDYPAERAKETELLDEGAYLLSYAEAVQENERIVKVGFKNKEGKTRVFIISADLYEALPRPTVPEDYAQLGDIREITNEVI